MDSLIDEVKSLKTINKITIKNILNKIDMIDIISLNDTKIEILMDKIIKKADGKYVSDIITKILLIIDKTNHNMTMIKYINSNKLTKTQYNIIKSRAKYNTDAQIYYKMIMEININDLVDILDTRKIIDNEQQMLKFIQQIETIEHIKIILRFMITVIQKRLYMDTTNSNIYVSSLINRIYDIDAEYKIMENLKNEIITIGALLSNVKFNIHEEIKITIIDLNTISESYVRVAYQMHLFDNDKIIKKICERYVSNITQEQQTYIINNSKNIYIILYILKTIEITEDIIEKIIMNLNHIEYIYIIKMIYQYIKNDKIKLKYACILLRIEDIRKILDAKIIPETEDLEQMIFWNTSLYSYEIIQLYEKYGCDINRSKIIQMVYNNDINLLFKYNNMITYYKSLNFRSKDRIKNKTEQLYKLCASEFYEIIIDYKNENKLEFNNTCYIAICLNKNANVMQNIMMRYNYVPSINMIMNIDNIVLRNYLLYKLYENKFDII